MSDQPFIPFYTSDFLAGTGGMTAATKGVYITLLCLIYEAEAPLSQDWYTLARRCGCTLPAFKKAIEMLADDAKIEIVEGRIWSEKCEKHLASRRQRRTDARSAAKKRWEKTEEKQAEGDAVAMPRVCQPKPKPKLDKERKEDANASLSSQDDLLVPEAKPFDEVAQAVEEYRLAAEQSGWPQIRLLSKPRRSALQARLKDAGGLPGWREALRKAQASSHCCGQNDRGWVISFDFLTTQSKFTKLMEGNYDDREPKPAGKPGKPTGAEIAERVADQWEAEQRERSRGMDHREDPDPAEPLLPARRADGRHGGGA